MSGIQDEYTGDVTSIAIPKSFNQDDSLRWIDNQNTNQIIALGKHGYRLAQNISGEKAVVIGAVPLSTTSNELSGISLITAPEEMFLSLQQLAPNIRKIHVVFNPRNRWLIDLAKTEAEKLGFSLQTTEVTNVKDALSAYDKILANIDHQSESVWLPLDPVSANEQVILPKLLEESWEQNLVLFSSKPAHAKRGVLFSLFPDHYQLGRDLVKMVTKMHDSKQSAGVHPIRNLKLAVNLRTAAHLGFDYKNKQKNQFHLTFPE
ncbi:hypothetical protein KIH87_08035 [Paraneptunicella aestuarii]|uniref:ABC transporter substrate binding protein n=1 Tax=Paraneptunicella aestuarii TaxID=2831148 RepID=UPI001E2C2D8E|nr:ABC transporter substrate binding protein [Paraneptunicella aestuarii]UAA40274.1 hypothetical protein KIH87_08035 [Paraneptunicella aestuarii]